MGKEISVIIPAYNEEKEIENTIKAVHFWLTRHNYTFEIIVINDGSTDQTHNIISNLAKSTDFVRIKSYRDNRGKGHAIRTGLLDIKKNIALILDADMSVRINELGYLNNVFDIFDDTQKHFIIKGQRYQVLKQPLHRIFVGKCFKLLTYLFTGLYMDTQCPFVILKLPKSFYHVLQIDGFAYDVEILYFAKQGGFKIIKKNVPYYNKTDSKVTTKKALLMFKELHHIRKRKDAIKGIA
jgi:dolichyl-phosphate beta-glucosyltransferase